MQLKSKLIPVELSFTFISECSMIKSSVLAVLVTWETWLFQIWLFGEVSEIKLMWYDHLCDWLYIVHFKGVPLWFPKLHLHHQLKVNTNRYFDRRSVPKEHFPDYKWFTWLKIDFMESLQVLGNSRGKFVWHHVKQFPSLNIYCKSVQKLSNKRFCCVI